MSYYSADKALSYEPILYMLTGARGGGKTYHWKVRRIARFLKTGEQTVWIRRYDDDIKEMLNDNAFISDIYDEFDGVKFEIKGRALLVNGEVAIRFIALSKAQRFKSTPFPKVTCAVFDEFILSKCGLRYINNDEALLLEDLLSTIFRNRKVLCVCIANAITFANPYFIHYRIRPFSGRFYFDKQRRILCEMWQDDGYREMAHASDLATLTCGSKFASYAFDNEFLQDSNAFIEKRPNASKFLCSAKLSNGAVGFWLDEMSNKIYTSFAIDTSKPIRNYTLESDAHDMSYTYIKSISNTYLAMVATAWQYGKLRFDDIRVKAIAMQVLAYINII